MRQYLDTLRLVLEEGTWLESRTGIRRISFPGVSMRFDLAKGFPAVTTRKLAFKSAIGELCALVAGATSARDFRENGSPVWGANANQNQAWLNNPYRAGEDDLGPIYGAQWRGWDAYKVLRTVDSAKVAERCPLRRGYKNLAYFDNTAKVDLEGPLLTVFGVYHRKVDQLRECLDINLRDPPALPTRASARPAAGQAARPLRGRADRRRYRDRKAEKAGGTINISDGPRALFISEREKKAVQPHQIRWPGSQVVSEGQIWTRSPHVQSACRLLRGFLRATSPWQRDHARHPRCGPMSPAQSSIAG